MAEQQNNVNTNKSFLDFEGLQKFWGIIKDRAANSLGLGYTDNNGISLTLKNIKGDALGNPIVISAADRTNPGLMTPQQVETLTNLTAGVGLLDGIKFGPNDTAAKVTDKYLNIDLRYQKSGEGDGTKHELQIIDYNNLVEVTGTDGNPVIDDNGNPIKEPTVLTSIDVAEFVKASILDESTLIADENGVVYLKLVFNTDTGTSDVLINVDDLITQYSAGAGLEIENVKNSGDIGIGDNQKYLGQFKIKLVNNDGGTVGEPKNKYLYVGNNGLTTTDALDTAVKATTLQEDITISGGPLAEVLNNAFDEGKIPAGYTLENIISALALKIYDGSISGPLEVWNPSINQPTLKISNEGDTSITKEIGNTIQITYEPNNALNNNNKPTRYYSFTDTNQYGIWVTESADDIKWETDSDGKETDIPKFGEGGTTLKYIPINQLTSSNKYYYVSSSTGTTIDTTDLKITSVSIKKGSNTPSYTHVAKGETFNFELDTMGENKITVTQSGAIATGGAVENVVACPANSLGNCIYTGYKVLKGDLNGNTTKTKNLDAKSKEVTITVKRSCWFGSMKEVKINKTDIVNNNINGKYIRDNLEGIRNMNFSSPNTSLTVKKGDKQVIIATGKKIEKVKSLTQNADITVDFTQLKETVINDKTTTLTDYIMIGGYENKYPEKYYVYVWNAATDDGFDNDTLNITYVK